MKLLVVEDDAMLASSIAKGLAEEGFEVEIAATGEEAFFLVGSRVYDVVLLDIMLPGRSGFEVLEALRKARNATPVLCLTARDAVQDRVRGLNLGADDYLVKPFVFDELLARVRALLRRGRAGTEPLKLLCADLELDLMTRRARRAGREITLSAREYELLEFFLRNQGRPLTRDEIMQAVWKEQRSPDLMTNVVDVTVKTLRDRLGEEASSPTALIRTVRGVGYEMRAPGGRKPSTVEDGGPGPSGAPAAKNAGSPP
jgi:two-component system copper resistance phosphate regulon response regulator CusR